MRSVSRREALQAIGTVALGAALPIPAVAQAPRLQSWPLKTPRPTRIHDVAPAPDGGVWFSAQGSGHLGYFDPAKGTTELIFKVPGERPRTYAVYVDGRDIVWIAEWTGNAIYSFDPSTEKFERYALPRAGANVRQILGRKGEVWLPESGTEHISVIRTS